MKVNPEIADLPWAYFVDNFVDVYYDLSYRSEKGHLSKWLRVNYSDGTTIDMHIDTILDMSLHPQAVTDALAEGTIGEGNRIHPAVLAPQTTPRLYAAKQSAIEAMEEYNFSFMLGTLPAVMFVITLGVGMPGGRAPRAIRTRIPRRPVSAAAGSGSFTAVESRIIRETRQILSSPEMTRIRAAHANGESVVLQINGRLVQYEPVGFSGFTNFEANGFVIGREAFTSEQELAKTILHELYRLSHSSLARGGGASAASAAVETRAAFEFAERAVQAASR